MGVFLCGSCVVADAREPKRGKMGDVERSGPSPPAGRELEGWTIEIWMCVGVAVEEQRMAEPVYRNEITSDSPLHNKLYCWSL